MGSFLYFYCLTRTRRILGYDGSMLPKICVHVGTYTGYSHVDRIRCAVVSAGR